MPMVIAIRVYLSTLTCLKSTMGFHLQTLAMFWVTFECHTLLSPTNTYYVLSYIWMSDTCFHLQTLAMFWVTFECQTLFHLQTLAMFWVTFECQTLFSPTNTCYVLSYIWMSDTFFTYKHLLCSELHLNVRHFFHLQTLAMFWVTFECQTFFSPTNTCYVLSYIWMSDTFFTYKHLLCSELHLNVRHFFHLQTLAMFWVTFECQTLFSPTNTCYVLSYIWMSDTFFTYKHLLCSELHFNVRHFFHLQTLAMFWVTFECQTLFSPTNTCYVLSYIWMSDTFFTYKHLLCSELHLNVRQFFHLQTLAMFWVTFECQTIVSPTNTCYVLSYIWMSDTFFTYKHLLCSELHLNVRHLFSPTNTCYVLSYIWMSDTFSPTNTCYVLSYIWMSDTFFTYKHLLCSELHLNVRHFFHLQTLAMFWVTFECQTLFSPTNTCYVLSYIWMSDTFFTYKHLLCSELHLNVRHFFHLQTLAMFWVTFECQTLFSPTNTCYVLSYIWMSDIFFTYKHLLCSELHLNVRHFFHLQTLAMFWVTFQCHTLFSPTNTCYVLSYIWMSDNCFTYKHLLCSELHLNVIHFFHLQTLAMFWVTFECQTIFSPANTCYVLSYIWMSDNCFTYKHLLCSELHLNVRQLFHLQTLAMFWVTFECQTLFSPTNTCYVLSYIWMSDTFFISEFCTKEMFITLREGGGGEESDNPIIFFFKSEIAIWYYI